MGAYPDKHVQLLLTPFLQLFYLSLARVADIQVVDSRSPSVPAGNSTYKAHTLLQPKESLDLKMLKASSQSESGRVDFVYLL